MTTSSANDWRGVIAALANPETRKVIGLLIVGEDPTDHLSERSPSRRRRILGTLRASGLITETSDGGLTLRDDVFAELLRKHAAPRNTGVERFLQGGRIAQYPSRSNERDALLRWVAAQTLKPGEVIDEGRINERLSVLADDAAVLRRYLVDAGIVERRRDGSEYALSRDVTVSFRFARHRPDQRRCDAPTSLDPP